MMATEQQGMCCATLPSFTGASSWLQRVPRNRFLRICFAPYSWTLRMCCSVMQRVSTAFELLPLLLLVMWHQVSGTVCWCKPCCGCGTKRDRNVLPAAACAGWHTNP
jgi:hypothetical protein